MRQAPYKSGPREHVVEGPGPAGGPGLLAAFLSEPGNTRVPAAGLAGGLRAWLEDGVAGIANASVRHVSFDRASSGSPTHAAALLERMTLALFRLVVTGTSLASPFEDALGALAVDRDAEAALDAACRLSGAERRALRASISARAAAFAQNVGPVPPSLFPKTRDVLSAPLAGGRVVLRGTADLAVCTTGASGVGVVGGARRVGGTGGAGGARRDGGVGLVRIRREGAGSPDPRRALRFLALVETLRSGTPPRHVVDLDPATGAWSFEPTTLSSLREAVHETLELLSTACTPHTSRIQECRAA